MIFPRQTDEEYVAKVWSHIKDMECDNPKCKKDSICSFCYLFNIIEKSYHTFQLQKILRSKE